MALTVRTNLAALSATSQLNSTQKSLTGSLEKISSGLRINKAADDAAGLAVATRMGSDNTSLQQAMRNTNDGISLIQTAEGSLNELSNILIRMRELSVQASNETYSATDRTNIATEMGQLKNEFARIVTTANFNRTSLLNSTDTAFNIQVGILSTSNNRIAINLSNVNATATAIGLGTLFGSIASAGNVTVANAALSTLDTAITNVSKFRANFGALQNRLENALNEASNYSQNLSAAQSQIMDVDYASESANMTRYQIMQQAGVAALAQAKALPQSIISLLS
jgi:flagellin